MSASDQINVSNIWNGLRESIRTGFWFIPGAFAVGAFLLALGLIQLDEWRGDGFASGFVFGGGFDSANSVLSSIVSSTMAFTVLTFSITIVSLQLASSQYSPRVLRTFLRDRGSQVPLGVFIATFVYSLIVLRSIRSGETDGDVFVPGIAVLMAIVLAIASVLTFVYFVNHTSHAIRAVTIMDSVTHEARAAIEANYPLPDPHGPKPPRFEGSTGRLLRNEGAGGVLNAIDHSGMVGLAAHHDAVIELVPSVGDYVPYRARLAYVHGGDGELDAHDVARQLVFGRERTSQQDIAFGIRQLVDIAERALSPGVNDPTTAVQALGRIEELLARIAEREEPTGRVADSAGTVRLVHPVASWDSLVQLAFDEIRTYGADHIQVLRRMRAALLSLMELVPPDRRSALEDQLQLLDEVSSEVDGRDLDRARQADRQGIGAPHVRS